MSQIVAYTTHPALYGILIDLDDEYGVPRTLDGNDYLVPDDANLAALEAEAAASTEEDLDDMTEWLAGEPLRGQLPPLLWEFLSKLTEDSDG